MAIKHWTIMIGGKTYMPYMIKSLDNSSGSSDSLGPITMGTKNVVYLSESGNNVKVYVKMWDVDCPSTELCLVEKDWTAHQGIWVTPNFFTRRSNRRSRQNRSDHRVSDSMRVVAYITLDFSKNTYYIPKNELRTRSLLSNNSRVSHIFHEVYPAVFNDAYNYHYKVHGSRLTFTENI